tara:strand:- start:2003 stop:2479 length:477 start_codon:yes stop_codon:yes gene_type:complete
MAYQKLQTSRALKVFATDNINAYPDPSRIATSGTNASVTSNKLVASGTSFTTTVETGYIVENSTDGSYAIVKAVDNDTTLTLSADIFTGTSKAYIIYSQVAKEPCIIFVGTGGDVNLFTADENTVLFKNIANASFLPVQTKVVKATGTATAADFIALW